MAKDRCRFHPDVFSAGGCKQCGVPLCDACKTHKLEGIFCGAECWEKYVKFQERISAHRSVRSGFFLGAWWKKLLIAVAIIAALAAFVEVYDVSSLSDLPKAISQLFSDIKGLF